MVRRSVQCTAVASRCFSEHLPPGWPCLKVRHLISTRPHPQTLSPSYSAPVQMSNTWKAVLQRSDPCPWAASELGSHQVQNAIGNCAEWLSEKRVVTDKSLIKGTNIYGDQSITVSIETFVDLWLGREALHLGHSFFFLLQILNKNLK